MLPLGRFLVTKMTASHQTPAEILKKIRALEIKTKGLVQSAFAGDYHSVFKGRGMNFEDVREYQPGDEIRAIDWNVTARLGNAFVKKFTEERELTVMLVVDVSASGNFGSVAQSKRELAAEVACLLAFSAIRNNDKVGLVLFSDRVELFIPPKKGRSHTLRLIREILYFEPQGRGTLPSLALDYLNHVVTRRSVVFFISDFQAEDFSGALTITSRRHDLIAIRIDDEREESIPDVGIITLEDLARYKAVWREPVRGTYRGHTLLSMPPASSGGITMKSRGRELLNRIRIQLRYFEPFNWRSWAGVLRTLALTVLRVQRDVKNPGQSAAVWHGPVAKRVPH